MSTQMRCLEPLANQQAEGGEEGQPVPVHGRLGGGLRGGRSGSRSLRSFGRGIDGRRSDGPAARRRTPLVPVDGLPKAVGLTGVDIAIQYYGVLVNLSFNIK